MADAALIRGPAVIAPFPSDPSSARMWVLGVAGRLVTERSVPLVPGDFPHPLIMPGEQVVFSDLDTAYLVDLDTAASPVALASAGWLLPGVSEGEVWAVGEGNAWVQRIDVTTGQAGERFDTEGLVVAPFGAVADGLAVWPADEQRHGRLAFWTPGTEPVPIEMRDPQQSGWLAAGGDLVALVSPGSLIDIVDVRTGQPVSSFEVDLGEDLIVDGCFAPQLFLAVVGSSGRVVVHLVEDGSLMQELQGAQEFHGIGWTSPDQLLIDHRGRGGAEARSRRRVHRPSRRRGGAVRARPPVVAGDRRLSVLKIRSSTTPTHGSRLRCR